VSCPAGMAWDATVESCVPSRYEPSPDPPEPAATPTPTEEPPATAAPPPDVGAPPVVSVPAGGDPDAEATREQARQSAAWQAQANREGQASIAQQLDLLRQQTGGGTGGRSLATIGERTADSIDSMRTELHAYHMGEKAASEGTTKAVEGEGERVREGIGDELGELGDRIEDAMGGVSPGGGDEPGTGTISDGPALPDVDVSSAREQAWERLTSAPIVEAFANLQFQEASGDCGVEDVEVSVLGESATIPLSDMCGLYAEEVAPFVRIAMSFVWPLLAAFLFMKA
jgi:hypothetical protein